MTFISAGAIPVHLQTLELGHRNISLPWKNALKHNNWAKIHFYYSHSLQKNPKLRTLQVFGSFSDTVLMNHVCRSAYVIVLMIRLLIHNYKIFNPLSKHFYPF